MQNTQSKYALKAGTRLIFTDLLGRRLIGYFRFPAQSDGYMCVSRDRKDAHVEVIHKTDIIAVT